MSTSGQASTLLWNLGNGAGGINVGGAWEDYTGEGIKVAVIDNGFDYAHRDLVGAFDLSLDYDFRSGDSDASAVLADDNHGTGVAALIAGANDGIGMTGVAYDATLIGLRIGYDSAWNLAQTTAAMAYAWKNAAVINNSWGTSTAFGDNFGSSVFDAFEAEIDKAVAQGRGGLGTVVIFSGGNYRTNGDNVNYHSYKNTPEVITVASIDFSGNASTFSTPGAALLVAAGGTSVTTADRTGTAGYVSGDLMYGSGTSYSAPETSGVVALMLEANPLLGYRDVQEILALTARYCGTTNAWVENGASTWNGGGMHFSTDVGFGAIDATAATRLAETWEKSQVAGNLHQVSVTNATAKALADKASVTSTVTLSGAARVDHVEKVLVSLEITHAAPSQLTVTLTSPDGTSAVLIANPSQGTSSSGILFETSANTFLGESEIGTWTLTVTDSVSGITGTLKNWKLTILGDQATNDTLHVYTDEFVSRWTAARSLLSDTDGGTDTVNMSAVTAAIDLDLAAGGQGSVGGKALTVAAGTLIERAYLGSANDRASGNEAANMLDGGRGQDTLLGGAGDDALTGGRGADTLTGGAGADRFCYASTRDAGDTITDYDWTGGDRLDVSELCAATGTSALDGHLSLKSATGGSWLVYAAAGLATDLVFLQGISSKIGLKALLGLGDPEGPVTRVASDDVYAFDATSFASAGRQLVSDQEGNDTIDLSAMTAAVTLKLDPGSVMKILKGTLEIDAGTTIEQALLGAGNDIVTGNAGDNVISGGAGNDQILGVGGADSLSGGVGNDVLSGGDGNDSLAGDAGLDKLSGGAGEDTLLGGLDADTLLGEAGNDRLEGGDGKDALSGGDGSDSLFGGALEDKLAGDAGEDLLDGGSENDTLDGGAGNDTLLGGDGADSLTGGVGADSLVGGAGLDRLLGGDDNDILDGGADGDVIDAGKGDDLILLGAGADTVAGGLGADIFRFTGGDVGLRISDFSLAQGDRLDVSALLTGSAKGLDPVEAKLFSFAGAAGGAIVSLDTNGKDAGGVVTLGFVSGLNPATVDALKADVSGDNAYVYSAAVLAGLGRTATVITDLGGIDSVGFTGVTQNVTFSMTAGGSVAGGGAITFGKGTVLEAATGGEGNDRFTGSVGNETISGAGGNDTLDGGAGNDVLAGGAGADSLLGGLGDDMISGDADADRIDGGAGNDLLVIGAGADSVTGGLGADVFRFTGGDAGLKIGDFSFAQGDRLDVSALLTGAARGFDPIEARLFGFTAATGGALVTLDANGTDAGGLITLGVVSGINPSTVDAFKSGAAGDTTYAYGPSVLAGLGKTATVIDDQGGTDTIDFTGATQNVTFSLTSGGSVAGGGAIGFAKGTLLEVAIGGEGNDRFTGSLAGDTISGAGGNDTLDGGAGNDSLVGAAGSDSLLGGLGDDMLFGGDDADRLTGGDGIDLIDAGQGADLIDGGAGNDVLLIGLGADTVTGGLGADSFRFVAGNAGLRITDFSLAQGDRLDVSALLTGAARGLDPVEAKLFSFAAATGGAVVSLDTNGKDAGGVVTLGFVSGLNPATVDALKAGAAGDTTYAYTSEVLSGLGKTATVIDDQGGADTIDFTGATQNVTFALASGGTVTGAGAITFTKGTLLEAALGGEGNDRFTGSVGNEVLSGAGGKDTLDGGVGNDLLSGGAGADSLLGGIGDDWIVGGLGLDVLTGGKGADVFVLAPGQDLDRITDFGLKLGDKLDIDGFDMSGDLVGQGIFALRADKGGMTLVFDADGAAGHDAAIDVAFLAGVTTATPLTNDWFA